MIEPTAWPQEPGHSARSFVYSFGSFELVTPWPVVALRAFASHLSNPAIRSVSVSLRDSLLGLLEGGGASTFSGLAWVAREWRQVDCRLYPLCYLIAVDGIGEFAVAQNGLWIAIGRREIVASFDLIVETLLGPALALAVSACGLFLLHASAVWSPQVGLVAFLGASGSGKSTLSGLLGESGLWTRVVDDAFPVRLVKDADGAKLKALPHFPQLKLPWDQQVGSQFPSSVALGAVFVLGLPMERKRTGKPIAPRLAPRRALQALLGHTVASRFFGPQLLEQHLETMSEFASSVPVYSLSYPWSRAGAKQVSELLCELPMTKPEGRGTVLE